MLKMIGKNPYDAFVLAQYGKMLKPRSLIQKVKGVDKHIERFRINVQKSQLQDCQTFENWWQFYGNDRKFSFLELHRQRTAYHGFVDQIKDERAANFLKILHKHETSNLPNTFDPLIKELQKCFNCLCKREKRRLPRKRAKPKLFKTSTKPEVPRDLSKKIPTDKWQTNSKYYKEPKPMEKIPKSILRKPSNFQASTNESPNQIISEKSSKKVDESSKRKLSEKVDENSEKRSNKKVYESSENKSNKKLEESSDMTSNKKVDENSEKKSSENVDESLEKKPNEKVDERSGMKWNEKKWKKVLEKKSNEDLNNISETSSNETLDERPGKKSIEKLRKTLIRKSSEKNKTVSKSGVKQDDTTDKKLAEPLEKHPINTISSYQRIHKLLNRKSQKRPSELTDDQLDYMLDILETKNIDKSDEKVVKSDEYIDEKLRKSREFSSFTEQEIAKLEKLLFRKSSHLKTKSYSSHNMKSTKSTKSLKSLKLHDYTPFSLGKRVMGRFSKLSKHSESKSTFTNSKNVSLSKLQKFATPRKRLDSKISDKLDSINSQLLKFTRSFDILSPRKTNSVLGSTSNVSIPMKSEHILIPEDSIPKNSENILTAEELIPGISEIGDVQREDSKAKTHSIISSTSSIYWRMMSFDRDINSMEKVLLQKYPPMDIEKHINAFMETLNFDKFKYESLPKNWPKSFESSLVKRFRRENRKTLKMKNTLTNLDNLKYRKTMQEKSAKKIDGCRGSKIKTKFIVRTSKTCYDLHSTSSCEICRHFYKIEPDPPYIAEMKKRQKQNDLKNYYRTRLIPRKTTTTLPIVKSLDDLAKELERTPSIREKLIICYQMLSDCRNIVDNKLKMKQSNERSL